MREQGQLKTLWNAHWTVDMISRKGVRIMPKTDIIMPKMDGWDWKNILRFDRSGKRTWPDLYDVDEKSGCIAIAGRR